MLFDITARFPAREFAPRLLSGVTTDAGTSVNAGIIITNARWSLDSRNLDHDRAAFVRLA